MGRNAEANTVRSERPATVPRKEAILASAVELFRRRGFHAVGIDEIGSAAGITGPGVYRHFRNKEGLLVVLIERVTVPLLEGAKEIVAKTRSPRTALDRLVGLHVAFAMEDGALVAVWVQEQRSLPEAERHRLRRIQAEYLDQWAQALSRLRPQLSPEEADAAVHAAVGAINSVAHHDSGLPREVLEPLLHRTAMAALLARPPAARG
jgi:AcrR family transcriptional regulator